MSVQPIDRVIRAACKEKEALSRVKRFNYAQFRCCCLLLSGKAFPTFSCFQLTMRLKWAGLLARMNEDRCCKKTFLAKPMGIRPRGRPR
ncbi:hypothetical protein TNCV_1085201 [Trichonephila clavipes]|nr:hypothetical protein TNCV_1085201 [Trichonephila clavipes]